MTAPENIEAGAQAKRRGLRSLKGQRSSSEERLHSRTRSRRRPAIIAIGVALTVVAALAAGFLVQNAAQTRQVFVAATPLEIGDVIEPGDLTTIDVPAAQQVSAYPVDDSDSVVGQYVTARLSEGSFVGPAVVAASAPVDEGSSIVGVALTSAQMPPYPLASGDRVRIVDTPINQGDPPADTPAAIEATVVKVTASEEQEASAVVAVSVEQHRAADLAARAATGRVALILDGAEAASDAEADEASGEE